MTEPVFFIPAPRLWAWLNKQPPERTEWQKRNALPIMLFLIVFGPFIIGLILLLVNNPYFIAAICARPRMRFRVPAKRTP